MENIKVVNAPKPRITPPGASFGRQILMTFIGTTISILLTLGTAQLVGAHNRKKDRRMSAMMVMSNIESFARMLDERAEKMKSTDSIATWLLSKPVEQLELLTEEERDELVSSVTLMEFLSYDKTAEKIFSNNIDTWKNMGNFQFIDQVGECFSAMNSVEEYWNSWVTDIDNTVKEIIENPDNYEGSTPYMKLLRNDKLRHVMQRTHNLAGWMKYVAASMRYSNLQNMDAIGISEQEVMDFTDRRNKKGENTHPAPKSSDYYTTPIDPATLTTLSELDHHLNTLVETHNSN